MLVAGVPVLSSASTTMLHERVPAVMLGRMFALRGGIGRTLDPLGAVVAGIVISTVAEPAMSSDGALRGSVGRVLATGDGRGAALVMILVGGALATIAIMARSSASLRQLDVPRPAGDARQVGVVPPTPVEAVGCRALS